MWSPDIITAASGDGDVVVSQGVVVGTYNGDNRIAASSLGGGSATLYIGNAAIQVSSDQRIKTNIADTTMSAVDKINEVRVVDFEWDDGGYESSSLNVSASSNYLLKDYGKLIMEDELYRIDKVIEEALNVEITKEIIDKHIFNFKSSAKVASNQIVSIFNNIKN